MLSSCLSLPLVGLKSSETLSSPRMLLMEKDDFFGGLGAKVGVDVVGDLGPVEDKVCGGDRGPDDGDDVLQVIDESSDAILLLSKRKQKLQKQIYCLKLFCCL